MICPECNGKGEIKYYRLVRGEHPMTVDEFLDVCHTCHGGGVKITSNADHIRSMTDEELAEFMFLMLDCVSCQNKLMRGKCNEDYFAMCKGSGRKCKDICLNWLKQPYKEDT